MPTAVIDTLLQTVAATRPAESPPRGGDSRGAFRPALDNALRGDGLRGGAAPTPTICPPPPVERPGEADEDPTTNHRSEDRHGDAAADTAPADPAEDSAAEQAVAADEAKKDDDAVEISEAAQSEATAAAPAALANASEKTSAGADATANKGDAQAAARAGAKQPGAQRAGHLAPKSESGAGLKTSETASPPAAEAIDGDLSAKATAREASSKKSGVGPAGEPSASDNASHAAVAKVNELADDADNAPSADAAGRDGRRSTGPTRPADAPPAAIADGDAKSTTRAGEPAPVVSPTAAAPPVSAANAPEPVAARVAASIARFSAGPASQGAASHTGADGTGQIDRARFVGRVEGAIRTAQQRNGRVHVRLSPPELGSLRIELTMHNGALSAHLEAETPAARHLLLDNLPALRDRLAQQDIRVDRFDVDVRSDGGGSGQQHNAQDRPAGDPTAGQRQERRAREAVRPATVTRGPHVGGATTNTNAALDVRV